MSEPTTREPHQSAHLARHRPRIARLGRGCVIAVTTILIQKLETRCRENSEIEERPVYNHTTAIRIGHIAVPNRTLSLRTRGSSSCRLQSHVCTTVPLRSSSSCIALPVITPSTSTVGRRVSVCQVIFDELGKDALAEGLKGKICEVRARRVSILAWPLSDLQQRELDAHGRLRQCVLFVACMIPP
ncbi:hypothetical protein OH76DRAFT_1231617 [Lentinus brumalis]|uniref:Uncharacterized protein n=1 Tax=Lentinus brumalis TaxID=2498619 RepID=A0A371CSE3_9APHY|nr:hypothetical protein OH76DRAFT_1231617 [Polyporus brumalis]